MSAEGGLRGLPLRAEEITAGYGGSPIVHGISISVAPGEVVSIVGPNGSGKSTFLKSLVGLVEIQSGTVFIGDREVTGWPPEKVARIGVGYVPQVDDVFVPLTVRENLEMGAYLLPSAEIPARLEHVLELFPQLGRMLRRRAGKLSGGERKMLAMGRALMLEPVLIVEQRAKAVLEISDRTYVLGGGRVRMEGTPVELRTSAEFVESFLGGGQRAAVSTGEE